MVNWHKYPDEKPEKEGVYLMAAELDQAGDAKFLDIGVANWFFQNHFVDVEFCDNRQLLKALEVLLMPSMKETEGKDMLRRMAEPTGYHVLRDGWYDVTPGPDGRVIYIGNARYWAELPCVEGWQDQNAYLEWNQEVPQ